MFVLFLNLESDLCVLAVVIEKFFLIGMQYFSILKMLMVSIQGHMTNRDSSILAHYISLPSGVWVRDKLPEDQ